MSDDNINQGLEKLRREDKDLYEAIRRAAFAKALKILKDPKAEIPPGQLLAFVAKVGGDFSGEDAADRPKINRQTNILAILPGLPPERAKQIVQQFQKELDMATKALGEGTT